MLRALLFHNIKSCPSVSANDLSKKSDTSQFSQTCKARQKRWVFGVGVNLSHQWTRQESGGDCGAELIGVFPEIQWIQGFLYITEAWIGVNLKILSVTCFLLALWYLPGLLYEKLQLWIILLIAVFHRIHWIQWKH